MQKQVAEFWYGIESCDNNIVHLRETWIDPYSAGNMWIVRGSLRDVLIDTGTGIVSPEPIVRVIAGKPVLAIACNCWFDHAGGLHFFADRGCHLLDADRIASPTVESSLVSTSFLFSPATDGRLFSAHPYADFEVGSYRMQGARPTVQLDHGDLIDLGDRILEVVHMPGMTRGSIALWEAKTGSLFTSDALYDDPLERPFGPVDPETFATNLDHLRKLPVTTVYPGHFGRFGYQRMHQLIDRYFRREAN